MSEPLLLVVYTLFKVLRFLIDFKFHGDLASRATCLRVRDPDAY